MRQVFLLLTFLFCTSLNYSQKNNKINTQINQNVFTDSIQKLNQKIDRIELTINEKVTPLIKERNELKKEIANGHTLIEYQNSIVTSYGQIFTILAILIAIITLIIPLLTYLFGIRPSKKALRDLDKNMNKKLQDYLTNSRNNEIENALENIRKGNTEL